MKKHPEGKLEVLSGSAKPELWTAHQVKGTPTLVFEDKASGRSVVLVGLTTEGTLEDALSRLAARAGVGGIFLDYTKEESLTIDLGWEYPGLNGTMTVPKFDIRDVRKLHKLDAQSLRRLEEEKEKIRKELELQNQERKAADDKRSEAARKEAEKIRKEAEGAGATKESDRVRKDAEDLAKGLDLFTKYPPPDWGPERFKQMQAKNLGRVPLTPDEKDFMENYNLWDIARRYMQRKEEMRVESLKKEEEQPEKKKEGAPPPPEGRP